MKMNNICFYLGLMLLMLGLMSLISSYKVYSHSSTIFLEWEFFNFSSLSLVMLFMIDWMSLSFCGVVLLISSMVLIYSFSYMKGDLTLKKFIFLVFLFVLSMLLMIMSPNLMSILLGWDGLGLVSYCLVIYYQNNSSANAGMLTILSNRIGDVALLLAICWALNFGSFSIFMLVNLFKNKFMIILFFFIVLAALTKSAQIPFSAWLPAAMAAPTPVSALVHSSTLVTAGVYLLIRFNPMLSCNYTLFLVAVLTMVMSGIGAMYETDLKKIIALSTLSQLGIMMMILSIGMEELAYFHLLSHALFKSLLFLCAGFYIHSMGDCQDIRFLGSLWTSSPIISMYFMAASSSLCGFPFLSGFYSKDMVLEFFFMPQMNFLMLIMIYLATLLTMMYSLRLVLFIYLKSLSFKVMLNKMDDKEMYNPMMILFFFSISGGSMMFWTFFPSTFIYISLVMKMLIILSLILVGLLVLSLSFKYNEMKMKVKNYYLSSMWGLPFYFTVALLKIFYLGVINIKTLDHGWMEHLGGSGSMSMLKKLGFIADEMNLVILKSFLLSILFMVSIAITLH